jgi:hypothetical protein
MSEPGALPGPGKYDQETTALRLATGAHSVVVMVIGGRLGEGFEVQSSKPGFTNILPNLLRDLADSMEMATFSAPHPCRGCNEMFAAHPTATCERWY